VLVIDKGLGTEELLHIRDEGWSGSLIVPRVQVGKPCSIDAKLADKKTGSPT